MIFYLHDIATSWSTYSSLLRVNKESVHNYRRFLQHFLYCHPLFFVFSSPNLHSHKITDIACVFRRLKHQLIQNTSKRCYHRLGELFCDEFLRNTLCLVKIFYLALPGRIFKNIVFSVLEITSIVEPMHCLPLLWSLTFELSQNSSFCSR